jgi:hypothetical protein
MALAVADAPTEPTSALIKHPAAFTDPPTTLLTVPSAGGHGPTWTSGDLSSAAVRPTVVSGTSWTAEAGDQDRLFAGLFIWLTLVWLLPRRRSTVAAGTLDPADAVDRLRTWTGLSAGGVADLLGVTRRSLYHWSTGATRPRHEERLLGLVRAIQPVSGSWEPWELRQWLAARDARQLVQSDDMETLRALLDDAVRPSAIRRLRPATAEYREDVEPLDTAALRDHFMTTVTPRVPNARANLAAPFVPRELTDSELPEDG